VDLDDGTTSAEQNPSHTFRRHAWYNVTMDARDAAGHVYRMNLLLHAWRPRTGRASRLTVTYASCGTPRAS
jgi:hypothetical protein